MPRIPFGVANSDLPASSGMRGGVVGTPVVQEPTMDPAAATLPGRALAEFGNDLTQTGQYLQQAEAFQYQREEAQGVLEGTRSNQVLIQRYQPAIAERQKGDYKNLATDVVKLGKDLIEQVARERKLSPQARSVFQDKAEIAINHAQAKALETENVRFQQEIVFAGMTEVEQVQQEVLQAQDDTEVAMHMGRLEDTLRRGIPVGLWTAPVAAKMLSETKRGISLGRAQMATRTNPAKAVQDILTRMDGGKATLREFQEVGVDMLPKLFDEAQQRLAQQVTFREAEGTRQRRALQEQQQMRASEYRAQIYRPGVPTETLLGLIDPINQDRRQQALGEADHTQLLGHVETLIAKRQDDLYKDRDIGVVATEGRIRIESAQTPADLAMAQQWVHANKQYLSSDTIGSMLGRITTRGDQNDPLNDEVAKEAKRLFLSGAFPGGIVPAVLDKIDAGIQAKTSTGLDVLHTELRRIYDTEGRDAMRAKGIDVGRRLKDLYFPEGRQQQGPLPAGLPPAFEGVSSFEDGVLVLDGIKLDPAARRKIYMQLKESLPRRKPLLGVPQGTGVEKVPGYSKPRTPYTPIETR